MASPLKTPDSEWRALVEAVPSEANRWRRAQYSRVERPYHPDFCAAESTTSSRMVRIPTSSDLTRGPSLPSALPPHRSPPPFTRMLSVFIHIPVPIL